MLSNKSRNVAIRRNRITRMDLDADMLARCMHCSYWHLITTPASTGNDCSSLRQAVRIIIEITGAAIGLISWNQPSRQNIVYGVGNKMQNFQLEAPAAEKEWNENEDTQLATIRQTSRNVIKRPSIINPKSTAFLILNL